MPRPTGTLLTPLQQRIFDLLSDGLFHTFEEIKRRCYLEDHLYTEDQNIRITVSNINKRILHKKLRIVPNPQRVKEYQLVRMLDPSDDYD